MSQKRVTVFEVRNPGAGKLRLSTLRENEAVGFAQQLYRREGIYAEVTSYERLAQC